MRMLKGEIFPFALVLVDNEEEFYKLTAKEEKAGPFPLPGAATTLNYSGDGIGSIILVALGSLEDSEPGEAESILTHEAVHVKQFVLEDIGEDNPGVETEAYFIQYIANYLIKELHYRQAKQAKKEAKENGHPGERHED